LQQVHSAVLKGSNKEVVLKVLKPGVSDILTADLSFLYVASRVLEFLNPELKRTSLSAIVGDIRSSMMEEVDFLKEQRNIGQFQVRAPPFTVVTHQGPGQGLMHESLHQTRRFLREALGSAEAVHKPVGLAEEYNKRVWADRTTWNA